MNDDKLITIINEDNKEHLAEVLFTFNDDYGENYVLLTLIEEIEMAQDLEHEFDVLAYKYEELEDGGIGNLIEINDNDSETWQLVEDMFETFQSTNFEMQE